MARVPLPTREALTGAPREVYDRIAACRGVPVENVFLALVNTPDLADGVLGLASALRASTALPRPLRELAIVTVGLETGAEYEVNHHWNAASRPACVASSSKPCPNTKAPTSSVRKSGPSSGSHGRLPDTAESTR